MPIVTLTTDLGVKDYALPALKGALLSRAPSVQLVDITHDVLLYNMVYAAFVLGNAWRKFPEGTIHLVWVNNHYARHPQYVVLETEGHFFIAPDNGVLSLMHGEAPPRLYRLEYERNEQFSLRELYAFAVQHLVSGELLERIGVPQHGLVQRLTFQPVTGASSIRGVVVLVDNFGNTVLNISRQLFEAVGQNRSFELHFKRHSPLRRLSQGYSEVPVGSPLCLFNSAGLLEIAVYMDNASLLLGLELEDMVEVVFEG